MQILSQNFKPELRTQMMNERTFTWNLPNDAVQKLVSLDKKQRIDFFGNLPMDNVPIGALMDFSRITIDDKGQVSFYITPQEFHYNPLGTVHGAVSYTHLTLPTIYSV